MSVPAARAAVAPAALPRATPRCSRTAAPPLPRAALRCSRAAAPLRRRGSGRNAGAARASLIDTVTTVAEASAGLVALQLVGRAIGAGGRQAAANTAATALGGVAAAPDVMFGFQKRWVKLSISLVLDGIGVSSFLLPGLGEATDAGWAPISALLVQALYGSKLLTAIDFIEEVLPFSDALPTACIGWSLEYTPLGTLVGFVPKDAKPKSKP